MIRSVHPWCQATGKLRAQRAFTAREAIMLSFADRVLGLHLGLGDLGSTNEPCMTYACGCACKRCSDRAERVQALEGNPRAAELAANDSNQFFQRRAAA